MGWRRVVCVCVGVCGQPGIQEPLNRLSSDSHFKVLVDIVWVWWGRGGKKREVATGERE